MDASWRQRTAHWRDFSSLQRAHCPQGSKSERITSLLRVSSKTIPPSLHWYAVRGYEQAIWLEPDAAAHGCGDVHAFGFASVVAELSGAAVFVNGVAA